MTYLPKHFEETDSARVQALVRSQPLATWVLPHAGQLLVNHVPFMLDADRGEQGTLVGHVARANPVWQALVEGHPQSLAFYLGSEKSYFALPPMLTEDSLLFADREEPVLWAFDKKTGLPAEKICALSDGQGGSVSLYYLKDTYLLSEQAFLAVSKHGIFRIEKIPCPELSSGPLDQIRTLENALYTKVMDAVQAYASASIDCDIGALMLEFSNKKLELCLIAPRDLAGIQGYSNTTLAKESLDPVELGLDWVLPDTWPHDRLVEKDLKNAQRALLESVMERVATTDMECYYKQNLYLIIEMYNESIDRNSTFVYKILRK